METLTKALSKLIRTSLDAVVQESTDPILALDDYYQQLEIYLEVIREMGQAAGKNLRDLRKQQAHYQAMEARAQHSARQFSGEGQTRLAQAATLRQHVMQQAAASLQPAIDAQNTRFMALLDAKLQLEARLTETSQRRHRSQDPFTQTSALRPLNQ